MALPITSPPRAKLGGPRIRTVAVLMKAAAKVHRLAIQSRIEAAGFDILLERSEKWSSPADDDFLLEFLAHEPDQEPGTEPFLKWIPRLTAGAIYVLLLERQDAVNAWQELLGPEADTQIDGEDDDLEIGEHGLRKTYGKEAFYGSPSEFAAEEQIAFCFPEIVAPTPEPASPTKAKVVDQQRAVSTSPTKDAMRPTFKARPMPSTQATITPRLSRAAALRMGLPPPPPPPAPRRAASDASEGKKEAVGISGLRKAQVQLPASLRPPSVAPRLNKAAAARLQTDAAPPASSARERKAVDYSNTPGHKRSTSFAVASTAKPVVAPRQTRASMGRMGVFAPTSAGTTSPAPASLERERKQVDYSNTPGHKRTSMSVSIPSLAAPAVAPRVNRASLARTPGLSSPTKENKPTQPQKSKDDLFANTPGHKRKSMSFNLASLQAPIIAPRHNNASAARLAARPSSLAGSRPSSRQSTAAPHQDAPVRVKGAAPPSSYRAKIL